MLWGIVCIVDRFSACSYFVHAIESINVIIIYAVTLVHGVGIHFEIFT